MKFWRRRKQFALQCSHPGGAIDMLERRLLLSAAAYTWQNVNIGAGGFVDGIFFSPTLQNVIYARTDIGGLYKTTNDGTTWQQLLDFVGNNTSTSGNGTQQQELGVLSFAIDPENSSNLYADVGQYSGTNGDVLYSTNAGQTWSQTALSFYVGGNANGRGDGEQIAVDPNDSNIVLLGSNSSGLWESTNAGHSFTQVSAFSQSSTTFVLFDPTSGTPGSPSQTIYVGVNSTGSGTNLYVTINGGATWSPVGGTGTLPTGWLPGRAALSGGNLYLAYANAQVPATTSAGGIFRYTPASGAWANISPMTGSFGFSGVTADPNNPNTLVVSTFDHYSGPDQIWRCVNANAATPTWTELYDYATAQNSGFNGFDTTRNYSNAAYIGPFGDGIGNWASAIAINPFNSNQLMYGTGAGIWATDNVSNNGTNTQLTQANSWYFPDTGIEFTNADWVSAATSGTPLFSTEWDINGFAHTTLTQSPANGAAVPISAAISSSVLGTMTSIDFAGTNPNDDATVGDVGTNDGAYSTNDGITWTYFGSKPSGASGGSVAVTSTGGASMTIVWAPSGKAPYYSTNEGTTWTASGGSPSTGGTIIADRANPSDFYYYAGSRVYFSSNGGVSFTLETSSAPSGGKIAVNPSTAGDLWIAAGGGVYHSSNDGANFTQVSTISTNSVIALGAPAPGQTTPAIYVFATISGFLGIYRSDDGGSTWTQINNTSNQWGGLVQYMAADPNVFGRVYLAINGRGVILGNPASSLPAGWTDADIYSPGNPGWATSSTTLSNGSVVNQWTVNGGGAGLSGSSFSVSSLGSSTRVDGQVIATVVTTAPNGFNVGDRVTISGATPAGYNGTYAVSSIVNATTFTYVVTPGLAAASGTITAATSDQFNFAYESVSGDYAISAELQSLDNAGTGTPQAGVMFRAGTNPGDVFAAMVQTTGDELLFEYRTTTGGSVATASLGSVTIGSEYIEIVRSGSTFSAFYSSDDVHWVELGSPVTISSMPVTAKAGLAVTANYNPQLSSAVFSNVVVVPITFSDTSGNNTYAIDLNPSNTAQLQIFVNVPETGTPSYQIALSQIPSLTFNFGSGDDTLTVDFSNGNPTPSGGLQINAGAGGADTIVVPDSGINPLDLSSLSIAAGASLTVQTAANQANRTVVVAATPSIAATGLLDLGGNDLIAHDGNPTQLTALIARGYNGGNWLGTGGLTSSAAAATSNTALGIELNSNGSGGTQVSTFDGQAVSSTDVLVKYTYFGDANLDGVVNGSDYTLIDNGFNNSLTGWHNGDFNYDGIVNGDDYTLIDNAFNTQSAPLAVATAQVQSSSKTSLIASATHSRRSRSLAMDSMIRAADNISSPPLSASAAWQPSWVDQLLEQWQPKQAK